MLYNFLGDGDGAGVLSEHTELHVLDAGHLRLHLLRFHVPLAARQAHGGNHVFELLEEPPGSAGQGRRKFGIKLGIGLDPA